MILLHANNTRFGDSEKIASQVKTAMQEGKNVVICCRSQAESVKALAPFFPGALIEVYRNWGLKIWLRPSN